MEFQGRTRARGMERKGPRMDWRLYTNLNIITRLYAEEQAFALRSLRIRPKEFPIFFLTSNP